MKTLNSLVLIAFALPCWAQPQPQVIFSVTPVIAPRGTAITMVGTLPADSTVFWLPPETPRAVGPAPYDCAKNPTESRTRLVSTQPVPAANGTTTFTALIPASLPLGEYTLCASYTSGDTMQWYTVPVLGDSGRLQVVDAPGGGTVQVTSVPRVVYEQEGRYRFSVLGNAFSRAGVDNAVLLNGKQLDICWDNDPTCSGDSSRAKGSVSSTHQLVLDLPATLRDKYSGSQKVQVRVGSNNVNELNTAPSVTLAAISRTGPQWIAAIVFAALVVVIVLILGFNKSSYTVAGVQLSLLSTLLLDQATDTYSLARAQFYAWTGAAVFGYTYLTIAWTLLQGRLEFAPVPQNLPGIIAASAGTAVIAESINRSKPKGAGQMQPSIADFITTGGMVVPERLQFLVWTILGVATFLLLVVASDPATIATLPAIPNEFLTLMGVSSAGYLGGRLARKGGPVIDDILATLGSLTLELHGRYLSKNASFQIDGEDVGLAEISAGDSGDRLPQVVAKDESAQDPNIAKVLTLSISSPKLGWLTRKTNPSELKRTHTLSIINPDGQKAEWHFSIAGPTAVLSASAPGKSLDKDTLKVSSNEPVTVDASGSRVDEGTPTFKWIIDGTADAMTTPKNTLSLNSGTHQVTVEVTDAKQLRDTAQVTVVVA